MAPAALRVDAGRSATRRQDLTTATTVPVGRDPQLGTGTPALDAACELVRATTRPFIASRLADTLDRCGCGAPTCLDARARLVPRVLDDVAAALPAQADVVGFLRLDDDPQLDTRHHNPVAGDRRRWM